MPGASRLDGLASHALTMATATVVEHQDMTSPGVLGSDDAGMDEFSLTLCPRALDQRFWQEQNSTRAAYSLDIICVIASISLHVVATLQASRFLSGEAMAWCLVVRAISTAQELIQLLFAVKSRLTYYRHRQLFNTLHRLRSAVGLTVLFWCSKRRTLFKEAFMTTHTRPSKQLFSGLLQMPVQNIMQTTLHPVKFSWELALQVSRVIIYALFEAPMYGSIASNTDIAWFSVSVCNAANTAALFPWPGNTASLKLLTCEPDKAARFTSTLSFLILGAYAPAMAIYLLERRRKLRWVARVRGRADAAAQPLHQLAMPLWATVPVHLYLIMCLTAALCSLLHSASQLTTRVMDFTRLYTAAS